MMINLFFEKWQWWYWYWRYWMTKVSLVILAITLYDKPQGSACSPSTRQLYCCRCLSGTLSSPNNSSNIKIKLDILRKFQEMNLRNWQNIFRQAGEMCKNYQSWLPEARLAHHHESELKPSSKRPSIDLTWKAGETWEDKVLCPINISIMIFQSDRP